MISTSKKRLIILCVDVENFKSYYGKHTIGTFHPSFSCIIGPNGNGKSNVIDALLFVFGFRAKDIRMKKLEELIHNSENHQGINSATVTVHFILAEDTDDPNKVILDQKSTFTVSRTIERRHRVNNSIYRINGHECPFKVIADTLKQYGFDVKNNRFMILQGEVKSISVMKPMGDKEKNEEGLLEYIEDIIGTNYLIEPIEESDARLDQLVEERQKQIFLVRAADSEKKALEGPKDEAELYLEQQKNVMTLQAQKWRFKLDVEKRKKEEMNKRVQEQKDEISKIKNDLKDKKKEQKEKTLQCEGKKDDLNSKNRDVQILTDEIKRCEDEDKQKEKQGKDIEKKIKNFDQDIKKEEAKVEAAKKLQKESTEDLQATQQSLSESQKELANLEEERNQISASIASKTAKFRQMLEDIARRKAFPERKERQLIRAGEDLDDQKEQLVRQKEKALKAADECSELEKNAEEQQKKKQSLEQEIAELQEKKKSLLEKEENQKKERDELYAKHQQILTEIRQSQMSLQMADQRLQLNRVSDAATTALMAEVRNGTIKGLYGRLESLGWISEEYEQALLSACGAYGGNNGRLRSFVVETAEAAEQCICVLKDRGLGIESFMILEKMRVQMEPYMKMADKEWEDILHVSGLEEKYNQSHFSSSSSSSSSSSEPPHDIESLPLSSFRQAPLLYKLIVPQRKEFLPAFFQVVRNTVVAGNLDDATTIAYGRGGTTQRRRVVTLDGDVVDASGTMSSGGLSRPRQGRGWQDQRRDGAGQSRPFQFGIGKKKSGEEVLNEEQIIKERQEAERQIKKLNQDLITVRSSLDAIKASQRQNQGLFGSPQRRNMMDRMEGAEETKDNNEELTLSDINLKLKKLMMDKDSVTIHLRDIQKQISSYGFNADEGSSDDKQEQVQRRIEEIDASIEKLENKKKENIEEIEKIKKEIEKLNDEEKEVQKSIDEAGGLNFQQIKANVAGIRSVVEGKQKTIAQIKTRLHTSERTIKSSSKIIEKANEDKERLLKQKEALQAEREKLVEKASEHYKTMQALQEETKDLPHEIDQLTKELEDLQKGVIELQKKEVVAGEKLKELLEQTNIVEKTLENILGEIEKLKRTPVGIEGKPMTFACLSEDEEESAPFMKNFDLDRAEQMIRRISEALEKTNVDLTSIAKYKEKVEDLKKKQLELDEITKKRDAENERGEKLKKKRLDEFMAGFKVIVMRLKEMYQTITIGGDAELELVDSANPFSAGIIFSVLPPTKRWSDIRHLSGGEKTLASLALVFALHHYRPNPLYVMDEIDAELDFRNVSIIAQYIKSQTRNAQFIIISLRNNMFELADRLIGIYKTHDCTHTIAINPRHFTIPQEIIQKKAPIIPSSTNSDIAPTPLHKENKKEENAQAITPLSSSSITTSGTSTFRRTPATSSTSLKYTSYSSSKKLLSKAATSALDSPNTNNILL